MGTLNLQDAGYDVGVNVHIIKRDAKTGKIITERKGHNRCLRLQLMGITKWLNGDFNNTQPFLYHYNWIPRYLGLGTNTATADSPKGITSEVSINDTRLLNEISPRLKLPETNKIINKSTQNYIQLVINTYLPKDQYNGYTIAEAGLFGKASGNNCLFRITFEGIPKDVDSVIEVNWVISVISVDSGNQPYEEVDKTDLRKAMELLMDKISYLYPPFEFATDDMKNYGIYEYGRTDAKQTDVDRATQIILDDVAALDNVEPPGVTSDIIERVDRINGEDV